MSSSLEETLDGMSLSKSTVDILIVGGVSGSSFELLEDR
jgi:hypothetical protein